MRLDVDTRRLRITRSAQRHDHAVFAASSLTSAFNTAEKGLELDHPGFTAQYSYGSSQALVTQIINSAPSRCHRHRQHLDEMMQLVTAGLVQTPQAFSKNKLEIAVAPGNPKGIKTLADLAKPGLSVVLAAPRASRLAIMQPRR